MIDVKFSRRIYVVDGKKICVQKHDGKYYAVLIDSRNNKRLYSNVHFDTIDGCQAYIDREALNNGWMRALVDNEVLF